MNDPKFKFNDRIFWFLFLLGVGLFYYVKFASPLWITALFEHQQFAFLNKITEVRINQPLDFYLGRVQEVIFGPATQALSGLLLAGFSLKFLKTAKGWVFGLAVFVFLLMTKWEVLLFPPYGDAIGGPFAEALWLYKNSFNYPELFHQPNFSAGGPKVYFFSLYPTYLAIFYKLIPWTNVFLVVQHLLVFAMTAAISAMLRACLLLICESSSAVLATILFLGLPLIQSQSEAINMEMPSTFLMVWSAYALVRRKNGLSCVLAILSAWVKGTGVTACAAAAMVVFFNIMTAKTRGEKIKLFVYALAMAVCGLALVGFKFIFHDAHVSEGMVHWASGWPSLQKEFIFYLYLACVVLFMIKMYQERALLYPGSVIFLYAGMWFLLFFNFYAVSPRYRVAVYPFLIFAVMLALEFLIRFNLVRRVVLWLGVGVAFFYSYGLFYGTMPDNDHVLLERSLEYRNDLEVNRRLVKLAEAKYADQLIVAPFTLAQVLAIPELGYVHKKLDIMIYGFGLKYGDIKNYPGLKLLNPTQTVFVGVQVAPLPGDFPYPMGPKDIPIEDVQMGNKKATFFIGGFYIDALWRITRHKGPPNK